MRRIEAFSCCLILLFGAGCRSTADPVPEAAPRATTKVSRLSDLDLVIEDAFPAPRAEVFDAATNPKRLRQWLGGGLTTCEVDLRVGGRYRYVLAMPDGTPFEVTGEYREIERPARIVFTESYSVGGWAPLLVTTELTEAGGVTRTRSVVRHPSAEICAMNLTNLQQGVPVSHAALAKHLETSQTK